MSNNLTTPIQIATALLLHRGDISLEEIRLLPDVDSRDRAIDISLALVRTFDIEQIIGDSDQSAYPDDADVHFILHGKKHFLRQQNKMNDKTVSKSPDDLAKAIQDKFAPLGGIELDIPLR